MSIMNIGAQMGRTLGLSVGTNFLNFEVVMFLMDHF